MATSKISELHRLGEKRQDTDLSSDLSNFKRNDGKVYGNLGDAQYFDGYYECDWVSPYTTSACNADADIVIVLQDWASHDWMISHRDPEDKRLGYSPESRTNINLIDLLKRHFEVELSQTFATNMFPFIKPGGMNSTIPAPHMRNAATDFALPQIDIVKPKLVICLGLSVFNTFRSCCKKEQIATIGFGIENPYIHEGVRYWCQAHTGMQGRNMRERHGKAGLVECDWEKMAKDFAIEKNLAYQQGRHVKN